MSPAPLEPALRLLLARKLRGTLRRAWARLRSPRGAILSVVGLGLFALWIVAIVVGDGLGDAVQASPDPDELRGAARLAVLVFFLISVGGAFVHRGLFLPQGEIERLFSAPLSRSDLVRYRLLIHVARSTLGGSIFALVVSRRVPSPVYGFVGAVVTMQLLPVVNQALAILAGVVEGRLAKRLATVGRLLSILFGLLASGVAILIVTGRRIDEVPGLGGLLEQAAGLRGPDGSWRLPAAVRSVAMVFEPWARLVTATNAFDFVTWLAVCLGIWLLLFEATARLPVDFRELSLETSANVAARLRRVRRGGGAAAAKATRGAGWLRVPWWLGRGPTRAVAWRKGTTILRKSRGTLWVSTIVLVFVTLLSSVVSRVTESRPLRGVDGELLAPPGEGVEALALVLLPSLLVALLGVLYLSGGLRFDFREDLDRMETMRAWPIPPTRLFLATVLPQVVLVSVAVLLALALRVALTRAFHPALLGLAAFVPPFALAWVALDNAVFLFLPVRMTPGQGGMVANAGRAFVVLFLRMLLLSVVLALGTLVGTLVFFAAGGERDAAVGPALSAAVAAGWGALVLVDVGLLYVGGWLVGRFDVARDVP